MSFAIASHRVRGVIVAVAVIWLVAAASSTAAEYPAGGSDFNGGAQGWVATEASCNVPTLCSASGGYDGDRGHPPGSLSARTNIALNLASLFKSTVALQSPDFEVKEGGSGVFHMERRFSAGNLIDLSPASTYTVTLLDRGTGARSELLSETLDAGDTGFVGRDAAASVKAGHTYAISIETVTGSTIVGLGLLSGTTNTSFDSIALAVGTTSGGGESDRSHRQRGHGALTDSGLKSLLRGVDSPTAVLVGQGNSKRLLVRVKCPRKVGGSCQIAAQGMLSKRKAATARRALKVRSGKARLVVLRVKPRQATKLVKRKRLLVREKVRAGKARASIFRVRKLIRR